MRVRPPLLPIPTAIPGSATNTSQAVRPHANSNSVSGTSYPQVYGTERYGNAHASFGYSIPLADGNYNVTLDFAETYVTAAGQRIFSVSINGTQVLTNFDICAAAGGMNIDASTANTPPVLIINNVVYGNGGRCIHAYIVTNFWISGSQNGSQERSMH